MKTLTFSITFPNPTWVEVIKKSYELDPEVQSIISNLLENAEGYSKYSLRSGCYCIKVELWWAEMSF
jgi:hypothetical protein